MVCFGFSKLDSKQKVLELMKFCVISPVFSIAGVPLAQIRLAKALANAGHEVDLIFCNINQAFKFPNIQNVNIINFNIKKVRWVFLKLCAYFLQKKPAVIFSAEDHLNILVSICAIVTSSKVKISASSRVTPYDTYSNKSFYKKWLLKNLFKMFQWRINVLTCVSKDMVQQYQQIFGETRHQCIYNIVQDEDSDKLKKDKVAEKWILSRDKECKLLVAAGRLAYWKGFNYLIEACSLLKVKKFNFKLIILGDGPDKKKLQNLSKKLRVDDKVKFIGYVKNPLKYFTISDVFVLSSLVEGMPNALVEAIMCGCKIVSTNCQTGPKEILSQGKFGHLVPIKNSRALANSIINSTKYPLNKEQRRKILALFSEKNILNKHFNSLGI